MPRGAGKKTRQLWRDYAINLNNLAFHEMLLEMNFPCFAFSYDQVERFMTAERSTMWNMLCWLQLRNISPLNCDLNISMMYLAAIRSNCAFSLPFTQCSQIKSSCRKSFRPRNCSHLVNQPPSECLHTRAFYEVSTRLILLALLWCMNNF